MVACGQVQEYEQGGIGWDRFLKQIVHVPRARNDTERKMTDLAMGTRPMVGRISCWGMGDVS